MIYNQPGASSFSCPILRPSLALRATKQILYLNFQHDQEDFDFVCFLFTKRPNAGSSRLKEGSIALVLSEGAHIPRWQT